MDITEIFDLAREQAGGFTAMQFANSKLLKYANIIYKDIQNQIIRKVNEKYFYDILTADTLTGQNEYALKNASGTVVGLKKIITGNIKWKSTDTYFSKLDQSTSNISSMSIDEQKINPDQPSFIEIKDGSVFVFPAPTETIEGGLVIEGIVTLPDLTETSLETDIFPYNTELRDYHKVIGLGIVPYIHGINKQTDEKIAAQNEYINAVNTMLDEIGDRFNNDLIGALPNGDKYK